MYKTSLATLAALFGTASADVNVDFEAHLHGIADMDDEIFESMWTGFQADYGHLSPNKDLPLEDRKFKFLGTIAEIVEHNYNPKKTFTMGINQFSDMTDEEFVEFYNLKATAEQHCSATERNS